MLKLRPRDKLKFKYYEESRNRFLEDVKKSISEELNRAGNGEHVRKRIREFAATYLLLANISDKKDDLISDVDFSANFKRDFFKENQGYFSFIIILRRFLKNVLFVSKFSFYLFSMFVFFLFEYIWHYYPPFTNFHFNVTVEDIIKFFPPFC
jgi:hypothetical protein